VNRPYGKEYEKDKASMNNKSLEFLLKAFYFIALLLNMLL